MKISKSMFIAAGIGLLIGAAAGGTFAYWLLSEPRALLNDMGRAYMLEHFARGQYSAAEYPHSKQAIERYLEYLETYRVNETSFLREESLLFEKAIAHGRLAILEEEQNHDADALQHWSKAIGIASKMHWKKCIDSKEAIRNFILRVDSSS